MMRSCRAILIGGLAATMMLIGSATAGKTISAANEFRGNLSGTGTMESTGEFAEVFNVVLPVVPEQSVTEGVSTSSIYDFILDPKKLAPTLDKYLGMSFEDGSTLYFKNENGQFDFSSKSDLLTIKNKGTMDVNVEVNASLTGMDGIKLVNDNIFTNDKGATVYLAMEDSNRKIAAIDKYGAFLKSIIPGCKEAYKIGYNAAIQKYAYELKSEAELQAENIQFSDYAFGLTGACNSANKWPDLNGVLEPRITVVWTVTPRPDNVAPSIGKNKYAITAGRGVAIDVDLGSGNLAATGIKEIRFTRTSGQVAVLPTGNYSLENGMLRFGADYISTLVSSNIASRDYTLVFDDKVQTKIKITLTAEDEAPSIEETLYHMVSGQPVEINVNLGSGQLGATGIKAIKFVRASGENATLPSSNYTFTNGKLVFRDKYITDLIAGGTISRDYTIVFNDTAGTEIIVSLQVNGQVPSISVNEYIMTRGQAVEVDVDLGSDDLKATGISKITFTRASGEVVTVPTENYTLAGDKLQFNSAYITSLINIGVVSRDYAIVFDNAARTQVKITLKTDDVSPSIEEKTYRMISGQPVEIDIELGSGNLGATGIRAITFTRASGETATLPTSNYALIDGKLKFNATYITNLINAGGASRDYMITFNDKAETKRTITLAVDGEAPSIKQKDYTMERGKVVEVNTINMGSSDLKATGISAITFTRASGEIVTIPTGNYTFTGGKLQFSASYISSLINIGVISRKYTVVFDNITKTKETITLTAKEVAPTINGSVYTMRSGQPVDVIVDLGSGTIGATSIKSITFKRNSGVLAVLPTSNYTLTNGVLKFNATYITNFISAGGVSRDYTITFNDKAETKQTITIKK